jgi:hypothetical protein
MNWLGCGWIAAGEALIRALARVLQTLSASGDVSALGPRRLWAHLAPRVLFTVIVLVGGDLWARPATAGTITYTWFEAEADSQIVTGELVVDDVVKTTGEILSTNIVSFNFSVTYYSSAFDEEITVSFDKSSFLNQFTFPLPVDDNGNSNGQIGTRITLAKGDPTLVVDFDSNYSAEHLETWKYYSKVENGVTASGSGYWVVSQSPVNPNPEPSSSVLLIIGVAGNIFYMRHRQK